MGIASTLYVGSVYLFTDILISTGHAFLVAGAFQLSLMGFRANEARYYNREDAIYE